MAIDMKIGIFGGTFDPIHMGHLIVADSAVLQLALDRVIFIPAGQPWFKASQPITPATHRMAMVKLAISPNSSFEASDMEINRPGPSYTADTLQELRIELGDTAQFYLILGWDALKEIHRWHSLESVCENATIVGVQRPGYDMVGDAFLKSILVKNCPEPVFIESRLIEISGAELRARVSEGNSIRYLVPESVESYISHHKLYLD